jgi:hypothetical protein
MSLSVTSLEFGSVQPGDSSAQTFAVRNGTASPLTITSARVKSNVFTLAFTLPVNVNGGDSVVLPVRFKPTSVGSFNDTLVVLSNVGRDSLALKGISSWPPVGVARDGDGAPSTFSLSQNYPNPFNPATTITFALPEASTVRLTVYDLIGREVAALVNDQLAPGYYRCTWNASRMPSGVYLYRMVSLSSSAEKQQIFEAVKKLLLVK